MTAANIQRVIQEAEPVEKLWLTPDMSLVHGNRQPAPAYPLQLLPVGWQEWVSLSAGAKNCPLDFIAQALLTGAAGLIGNARRGKAWQEWQDATIVWSVLVGLPSTGKSPAVDTVMETLRVMEADSAEQYSKAVREYEAQREAAKHHEENWQEVVKEAAKAGNNPPPKPAEAIAPEEPARPRIVITDATSEKSAYLLSKTPKGLLLYRDELSGVLANFERRGGSDRGFYIEAYGGRPYVVDRVKHQEPIVIPSLALSIIGGIQPDRLHTLLMQGDDDGLAARFLYVWPEPVSFRRPTIFPDHAMLLRAFRRLHALQPVTNDQGKPVPVIIPFEERAAVHLEEWRKEQPEKEAEASGLLLSHIGKVPGMAIRLATVLCYLEWALEESQPEPDSIKERHVLSAIGMLEDYYLPMARRCFGDAILPQDQKDAMAIARWIAQEKPTVLNFRELTRTAGFPLKERKRLGAALEELQEVHWIRFAPIREGERKGRQQQNYQVNPKLWERNHE